MQARLPQTLLFFSLLIIATSTTLRAYNTYFWLDETYTALSLTLSDFSVYWEYVITSEHNPPLFYVAIWLWTRIFGLSDLGIRSFSILLSIGTIAAVWYAVKRSWGSLVALTVVPLVFLLIQRPAVYCEPRPTNCLAFVLALTMLAHAPGRLSRARVLHISFGHAGLCLTHTLGCVYSGAIFLAAVVSCQTMKGPTSWRVPAAIAAGWLGFIVWLPGLLIQFKTTLPEFWIPCPTAAELFSVYSDVINVPVVLGVLMAGAIWALCDAEKKKTPRVPAYESREQITMVMVAFAVVFLVPLVVFAISLVSTPIFLVRYFEPSVVCWAIVFAWLYNQMQCLTRKPRSEFSDLEGPGRSRVNRSNAGADRVARELACETNVFRTTRMHNPDKGLMIGSGWSGTAPIIASVVAHVLFLVAPFTMQRGPAPGKWTVGFVPDDLPFVCESPAFFLPALRYAARPNYLFVLDRSGAFDPDASGVVIEQYKSFVQLKKYFPEVPVVTEEELTRVSKFAVLEDPVTRWSESWVRRRPEYVRKLVTAEPAVIILVERRQSR